MDSDLDIVTIDTWHLARLDEDPERRVRDVDLGERLGIDRPRKLREIIKRHRAQLENLGVLSMRPTVGRIEKCGAIRGVEERTIHEYWLNRDQALYIAMKSETPKANEISIALVLAFRELERRLAEVVSKSSRQEAIYRKMLLEQRRSWELLWTEDVPRELARLYEWDLSNAQTFPVWMGNITARIYDLVVGKETMDEARRRRAMLPIRSKLHDWFQEQTREHFRKRLDVVLALIQASSTVDDFWARMARVFGAAMQQLHLAFDSDGYCRRCGVPLAETARFCGQCGHRTAAA